MSESETAKPSGRERAPNTLLNGVIGGVLAVVFGFIPFSTVLGGGVAGYLEGGEYDDGAKVGVIAFLPIAAGIALLLAFVPVASGPGAGQQLAIWLIVLLILLVSAVYSIGLSILGGVLGVYLKEEL